MLVACLTFLFLMLYRFLYSSFSHRSWKECSSLHLHLINEIYRKILPLPNRTRLIINYRRGILGVFPVSMYPVSSSCYLVPTFLSIYRHFFPPHNRLLAALFPPRYRIFALCAWFLSFRRLATSQMWRRRRRREKIQVARCISVFGMNTNESSLGIARLVYCECLRIGCICLD